MAKQQEEGMCRLAHPPFSHDLRNVSTMLEVAASTPSAKISITPNELNFGAEAASTAEGKETGECIA